jgi:hypothetical protein
MTLPLVCLVVQPHPPEGSAPAFSKPRLKKRCLQKPGQPTRRHVFGASVFFTFPCEPIHIHAASLQRLIEGDSVGRPLGPETEK